MKSALICLLALFAVVSGTTADIQVPRAASRGNDLINKFAFDTVRGFVTVDTARHVGNTERLSGYSIAKTIRRTAPGLQNYHITYLLVPTSSQMAQAIRTAAGQRAASRFRGSWSTVNRIDVGGAGGTANITRVFFVYEQVRD